MKKLCALLCALALLIAGAAQAEEACLAAYREALENLYYYRVFPDGSSDENAYNVEGNGFAVYDVDGDGRRELIIDWSDTVVASSCGLVFDYDEATHSLRTEYAGTPDPRFYDNGMLEELLSHNQGPSEDFWPYFLCQYDPAQDVYETRGNVEAMEKEVLEERGWDIEFPESADVNGNGTVYCIDNGDWVDDGAFEQWRCSFAGEGRQQRIPYVNLTLENIRDIR